MNTSQQTETLPRVSIGMPVYNGARYIGDAIQSVLEQSYEDFELIICDNASIDETERICREFAAKDNRIRYNRNKKNIGAGPNFNHVVSFARGEFFKWAAHDDLCHNDFLKLCVRQLDKESDAVLVYPKACVIDENSNQIETFDKFELTDHPDPVVRFKNLIKSHICYEVFGLMRLLDLKATPMIGSYARGDEIFLCWLGLRGRFVELDEYLFYPRRHKEQSMALLERKKGKRKADFVAYSAWFDPKWKNRMVFPWWRSLRELTRCVTNSPISPWERIQCSMFILKWTCQRRRSLVGDIVHQIRQVTQSKQETQGLEMS